MITQLSSSFISIVSILSLFSPLSLAADREPQWSETIRQEFKKQISQSGLASDHLGIYVTYSDGNEFHEVYSLNAEKAMIPASTTKILTAAAAIEKLGPGKKFETHLKSSAKVSKGVLSGDLCLYGGGDPGFVSESMWFLVNEFVRTGVQSIEGKIVVDDSRFDKIRTDPSRDNGRVDRAYDAPIGAMSFNWNSINVFVRPGESLGAPARVWLDPENAYTKLVNRATTAKTGAKLNVSRESLEGPLPGDVIHLSGSIGLDKTEQVIYKNISSPDWWSGYQLLSFLKQRGISVKGEVKVGTCEPGAEVLAKAESKPVSQMLQDMLKFSNNYVAEMLAKNMAAESGVKPGSMEAGMQIVREFVYKMGVPKPDVELVNPSGLSRKNRIQPRHLHLVLSQMTKQFPTFAENLSAYPIAGIDGTLKNRMKGSPAEGWLRAKTGMLNGVSTLAGFAGRHDGRILTFVLFFNGKDSQTLTAMALFDRLGQSMVR